MQKNTEPQLNASENEEPILSPNDKDELLIEGDDCKNEQNDIEKSSDVEFEEEKTCTEQETDNISNKEQETESDFEKTRAMRPSYPTERGNGGHIAVIIILVILLLATFAACFWYYHTKIKNVQPVVQEQIIVHDTVYLDKKDTTIQDTSVVVPPTTDSVEQQPVYISRIANENKVPGKGWLIGYAATPSEAEAIKMVAEISLVDSLPCGYYWINDARPGKRLFKVYVGPYQNREDAELIFKDIKAKISDAHIYSEDSSIQIQ